MVTTHQGKVLQQVIHDHYLPAVDLAKLLNVKREYVYALFKKQYIPSEHIDTICHHFNVNPAIFFTKIEISGVKSKLTFIVVTGDVLMEDPVTICRDSVLMCQSITGL